LNVSRLVFAGSAAKTSPMKRLLAVAIALVFVSGCARFRAPKPTPDELFAALSEEYIRGHLAWRPAMGTGLGLHEHDGRITDYSRASLDAELARLKAFDAKLSALNVNKLTRNVSFDYRVLQSVIRNEIFSFEKTHAFQENPMTYAQAIDLTTYVKRDFAPLEKRVRSIVAIEMQTPALFTAARANLNRVLPKPFVETAIDIAEGHISFLEKDLPLAVKPITNAVLVRDFEAANKIALSELRAFVQWLRNERLPRADASYALGTERYREMLRIGEFVDLAPEKILELGLRELKTEQERFDAAAKLIDPSKPPIEVFRALQQEHPTAEALLPDTRKNLEAIREFVVAHRIVTIPSDVRVRVEETPPPFRRTSFASMDTPGVFETNATEAYYYVTPTEPEWPQKQKDEWLTAFNYFTTDIVSIHEAYPGHYVQFLALKDSGASRIAKIFSSYAFVEGWAHYTEQMLFDEGFGKLPVNGSQPDAVRAAKYRLAQSDEALLRLCRLCVSIKLHTQGMSVDDATKFFMENCHYEEKPARQEAIRGTFDPGYLNYTLGKLMILKLRRDWQAQEGARYSLQRFHDELLRHGAPALPLLRERMLKDTKQWHDAL
jgi:uncharacterized protein (DUF885 family)